MCFVFAEQNRTGTFSLNIDIGPDTGFHFTLFYRWRFLPVHLAYLRYGHVRVTELFRVIMLECAVTNQVKAYYNKNKKSYACEW